MILGIALGKFLELGAQPFGGRLWDADAQRRRPTNATEAPRARSMVDNERSEKRRVFSRTSLFCCARATASWFPLQIGLQAGKSAHQCGFLLGQFAGPFQFELA